MSHMMHRSVNIKLPVNCWLILLVLPFHLPLDLSIKFVKRVVVTELGEDYVYWGQKNNSKKNVPDKTEFI